MKKKKFPSIKDAKQPTKTDVKYFPGLGYAPVHKAKKRSKLKIKTA